MSTNIFVVCEPPSIETGGVIGSPIQAFQPDQYMDALAYAQSIFSGQMGLYEMGPKDLIFPIPLSAPTTTVSSVVSTVINAVADVAAVVPKI